jgi:hypothetical protein
MVQARGISLETGEGIGGQRVQEAEGEEVVLPDDLQVQEDAIEGEVLLGQ